MTSPVMVVTNASEIPPAIALIVWSPPEPSDKALSEGSGGDQTMSAIAGGISEALVTTMTGLVIALPGLFFQYVLGRKFAEYRYFLDRLETMCRQRLLRRSMVA